MRSSILSVFLGGGTGAKAAHAAAIVAACYVLSQVARLVSNLILTRLLAPEIFGMMAILNIFIQGMMMFSDMGINLNIIQSKNAEKQGFLNSAWTLQVMQGVGICLIALLAAWPLSIVYDQPQFLPAFIVLGLGVLIQSFVPTKLVLLEKNFLIMRSQLIQLGTQLCTLIVIVMLAYSMESIWALVLGQLAGNFLMVLAAHCLVKGPGNRFCWDGQYIKEIFHFGKWVFLGSLFSFLNRQGDKLVLSFAIPFSVLGIFTLAVFIVESIERLFSLVISKVALPLFAKFKNEEQSLSSSLMYRARRPVEILSAVIGGLVFFNAQHIIDILYDERYADAGWMLQILSLTLFLAPPTNVAFNYFTACGKPKYSSVSLAIQAVVLALGLPVFLTFFELAESLVFVTGVKSLGYLTYLYIMIKRRELLLLKELRMLATVALGLLSGFMASLLYVSAISFYRGM